MNAKQKYILFAILAIVALALCPPDISLAHGPGYCSSGCPEEYCTECGECFIIGECCDTCCCDEECEEECLVCSAGVHWDEYKCDSPNCDGDILVRHCESYVSCPCCCGPGECVCVKCTAPEICEECQSWQKPIRKPPCDDCTKWGLVKPDCLCRGECIEKVSGSPRYYYSPLYPKDECNAEQELQIEAIDKVYLPVKFDWDDVKGWRGGWKEDDKCKLVLNCSSGNKACYETYSDSKFEMESEELRQCKKNCWGSCYDKIGGEVLSKISDGYWIAGYQILEFYKTCIKDCEESCQNKSEYRTNAKGCSAICPGVKEKCYLQPEGYVQSYVIKIEGEGEKTLRSCDALKKIDELENKLENTYDALEKERLREKIKKIKKEELEMKKYIGVSNKSEFIPPCPCMFKSNQIYSWKVRACCPIIKQVMSNEEFEKLYGDRCPHEQEEIKEKLKTKGIWVEDKLDEDCGPWSDWESITDKEAGEICRGMNGRQCEKWEISKLKNELKSGGWKFITSPAPEPKFPYDPDWAGLGILKNLPKTDLKKLKWCEIDDAKLYHLRTSLEENYYRPLSYELLIYYSPQELNERPIPPQDLSQYGECHPNLVKEGECNRKLLNTPTQPDGLYPPYGLFPPNEFSDIDHIYFTKITPYSWKVAACEDIGGVNCPKPFTDLYSQLWRFEAEEFTLDKPRAISPHDQRTPVGLPVLIQWDSPYAMSWKFQINDGRGERDVLTSSLVLDFPQLQLDTIYSWKVKPCWDFKSKKCENFWSDTFYFKTTGGKPTLTYPAPDAANVLIPVNFDWEDYPGAKSYIFKIQGGGLDLEKIVEKSEFSLDYPDIHQDTEYGWQVKTCAHENGEACGQWSDLKKFKTIKINPPTKPQPKDSTSVLTTQTHNFSWDKITGARYYQFKIAYVMRAEDEDKEECSPFEETKTILQNSITYPLKCKGNYQWQVRGCIDKNCQEAGDWNDPPWTFSLISEKKPEKGLVPCGRNYDNPSTPWDETDKCGIKDVFIMLNTIIDFLLWNLAPLLLVLLTVATGVIFYLSIKTESPDLLAKIKSLWKTTGIGYGIIFFAWIIVDLILKIFGYNVGIFGHWWQIPI